MKKGAVSLLLAIPAIITPFLVVGYIGYRLYSAQSATVTKASDVPVAAKKLSSSAIQSGTAANTPIPHASISYTRTTSPSPRPTPQSKTSSSIFSSLFSPKKKIKPTPTTTPTQYPIGGIDILPTSTGKPTNTPIPGAPTNTPIQTPTPTKTTVVPTTTPTP